MFICSYIMSCTASLFQYCCNGHSDTCLKYIPCLLTVECCVHDKTSQFAVNDAMLILPELMVLIPSRMVISISAIHNGIHTLTLAYSVHCDYFVQICL